MGCNSSKNAEPDYVDDTPEEGDSRLNEELKTQETSVSRECVFVCSNDLHVSLMRVVVWIHAEQNEEELIALKMVADAEHQVCTHLR